MICEIFAGSGQAAGCWDLDSAALPPLDGRDGGSTHWEPSTRRVRFRTFCSRFPASRSVTTTHSAGDLLRQLLARVHGDRAAVEIFVHRRRAVLAPDS